MKLTLERLIISLLRVGVDERRLSEDSEDIFIVKRFSIQSLWTETRAQHNL